MPDEQSDELRLSAGGATVVLTRLAPGVVLMTSVGHDTGQFGEAPFEWLEREMFRHGVIEMFVDTREMFNATRRRPSGWR